MSAWIDFRKLREQLDAAALLRHYGIELKANPAGQHHGRCPLPGHPRDGTSLSFSVSSKKKLFRCFGCGASGNLLDLAILLEDRDPRNTVDVRAVALKLVDTFRLGTGDRAPAQSPRPAPPAGEPPRSPRSAPPPPRSPADLPVVVNAPLDFALKNLDSDCAFLRKRGLLGPTVEHFGLGLCTKGTFAGRIAIPVHDLDGRLVGYAGLLTDTFDEEEETPEYLWPSAREHNGARHVFDRTKLLYHAHAIEPMAPDLYVVQSPASAWWLWQCGFRTVVAILGDVPSLEQAKAIVSLVSPSGRVWLACDGTKAGEKCAQELFFDLGAHRFCKWVRLHDPKPESHKRERLAEMLRWNK
jgi:DNA primase